MEFGLSLMPDKPIAELIRIYQMAERAGLKYGWTADEAPSPPFRDPYAVLAALGEGDGFVTIILGQGRCGQQYQDENGNEEWELVAHFVFHHSYSLFFAPGTVNRART